MLRRMKDGKQSDVVVMDFAKAFTLLQKMTAKNSKKTFKPWRSGRLTMMELHPDKCSVIRITRKKTIHRYTYTLHGQILAEETNTKYLGVTIADNMTWNTHIKQSAAKGNKKLGFLKRNLNINNPDIKSHAYKTMVNPRVLQHSLGPTHS